MGENNNCGRERGKVFQKQTPPKYEQFMVASHKTIEASHRRLGR